MSYIELSENQHFVYAWRYEDSNEIKIGISKTSSFGGRLRPAMTSDTRELELLGIELMDSREDSQDREDFLLDSFERVKQNREFIKESDEFWKWVKENCISVDINQFISNSSVDLAREEKFVYTRRNGTLTHVNISIEDLLETRFPESGRTLRWNTYGESKEESVVTKFNLSLGRIMEMRESPEYEKAAIQWLNNRGIPSTDDNFKKLGVSEVTSTVSSIASLGEEDDNYEATTENELKKSIEILTEESRATHNSIDQFMTSVNAAIESLTEEVNRVGKEVARAHERIDALEKDNKPKRKKGLFG